MDLSLITMKKVDMHALVFCDLHRRNEIAVAGNEGGAVYASFCG